MNALCTAGAIFGFSSRHCKIEQQAEKLSYEKFVNHMTE